MSFAARVSLNRTLNPPRRSIDCNAASLRSAAAVANHRASSSAAVANRCRHRRVSRDSIARIAVAGLTSAASSATSGGFARYAALSQYVRLRCISSINASSRLRYATSIPTFGCTGERMRSRLERRATGGGISALHNPQKNAIFYLTRLGSADPKTVLPRNRRVPSSVTEHGKMPRRRILDPRPIYYVYVLFDWRGIPRYVGKGKEGTKREDVHERKTDIYNQSKNEFIEQTWIMLEELPKVRIRENLSEAEAFLIEISFIAALGRIDLRKGPLVNMTNGGDGTSVLSQQTLTKKGKAISLGLQRLGSKELSRIAKLRAANKTKKEHSERMKRANASRTPEARRNASLKAWESSSPKRRIDAAQRATKFQLARTTEERSKTAKQGHARRSPESRSEQARLAANVLYSSLTKEERQEKARNAANSKSPEERSQIAKDRYSRMTKEERHTEIMNRIHSKITPEARRKAAIQGWQHRRLKEKLTVP
jgi:hypothetical protein